MGFMVIDNKTGKPTEIDNIMKEEWTDQMAFQDCNFALVDDGDLILIDQSGNYICCPPERFSVKAYEQKKHLTKVDSYTERIEGFQIRKPSFFGDPPKNIPVMFDVVKWQTCEPRKVYSITEGKEILSSEFCFVVGRLVWEKEEDAFRFESIGLRWLESKPSEAVVAMIMGFAGEMRKRLKRRRNR